MDKAAVSRLIFKAVALYNITNTIKMHNKGKAADYAEGRVKKRVGEQGKAWRTSYEEANKSSTFVADTQPLVGGVQRVAPPLGGSPPDDGPAVTPSGSGQRGEKGDAEGGAERANGEGRSDGRGRRASSGVEVGGGTYAAGPADDMLGNPHGADDADGDFSEDKTGVSEATRIMATWRMALAAYRTAAGVSRRSLVMPALAARPACRPPPWPPRVSTMVLRAGGRAVLPWLTRPLGLCRRAVGS